MVAQNYFEYFPTQRKMFSIIFPAQRSFYSSKSPKKVYFHRSSIPRRSMYKNSLSRGLESCFKNQNVLTLLVQGVFYVLHMFHKNLRNFCFLVSNTYWNKPNSGPFFVLFQGCSKEICLTTKWERVWLSAHYDSWTAGGPMVCSKKTAHRKNGQYSASQIG